MTTKSFSVDTEKKSIEDLSNLVFGLALTLGAKEDKVLSSASFDVTGIELA